MIWLGMPSRSRMRTWRVARTTIKQIVESYIFRFSANDSPNFQSDVLFPQERTQMPHLVRTLVGPADINRLPEAYTVLARAYLTHRAGGSDESASYDYQRLTRSVLASEEPIQVAALRSQCDLITTDIERPGEVFHNLGQMEVLIASTHIMRRLGLEPLMSAPTQQSKDDDGNEIADMQGDGWLLEAYGGQKCDSNQKVFEDLCTLAQNASSGRRLFLAFRKTAWEAFRKLPLRINEHLRIQGKTKKSRPQFGNEKVRVSAELELVGEHDGICVCEVFQIETDPPWIVLQTSGICHESIIPESREQI